MNQKTQKQQQQPNGNGGGTGFLDQILKDLNNRSKILRDEFEVLITDEGRLVTIIRKEDNATKEFKRATAWPRAQEFMNNLLPAQLNDNFPKIKK